MSNQTFDEFEEKGREEYEAAMRSGSTDDDSLSDEGKLYTLAALSSQVSSICRLDSPTFRRLLAEEDPEGPEKLMADTIVTFGMAKMLLNPMPTGLQEIMHGLPPETLKLAPVNRVRLFISRLERGLAYPSKLVRGAIAHCSSRMTDQNETPMVRRSVVVTLLNILDMLDYVYVRETKLGKSASN